LPRAGVKPSPPRIERMVMGVEAEMEVWAK
jgi:hypothetical protein